MDFNFNNKTVLITGGGSGLGKTIVGTFKKLGANVVFTYNSSIDSAKTLERENVRAYKFNQGNLDEIEPLVNSIMNDYGHIDVLINNAGIYPGKTISEITEKDFDEMIAVNTKGVFFLSRCVADNMKQGSIINISSINATNPGKILAHYGMSKAGVEMQTRSMAVEYGPNIRVNCIAPGLINRQGIENNIPVWVESYSQRAILKHLVEPEEVANTCAFLASDLSSGITGQVITVDCGVSLAPYFNNEE